MFQKVKTLSLNLVVYGMGDVAVQVVGFLLLPLFTRILEPGDYGILALLMTVEIVAKILFRFGIDASFMRLYYDCRDERSRQRLASTIFFFLLAVNGVVLALALAGTPWLGPLLFGRDAYRLAGSRTLDAALALVLVNTFVGGFFFIPFHLLRIEGKPVQFSALTFARAASTVTLRVVFIAGLRLGVIGFILADIVTTAAFAMVLTPWFARVIRPVFSLEVLREALNFGLPRVPHGVAQQVIGPGTDAAFLRAFLPAVVHAEGREAEIGRYQIGATFAATLKLFLSAFEYAWAPFYFATMKEADAKKTFSRLTTYGIAVLVFLAAGLSAVAPDLVRLVTRPRYFEAADVIPWIALGVTFQGVYLLTSIGLNITKHTEYYPVATGIAAAVNVGANMLLIPRYGILGPAYANALSYATLAAVSFWLSQRFYPMSYEWSRLARLVFAGVAAYVLSRLLLPGLMYSPVGVLARGSVVVVVFPVCLAVTGFFRPGEIDRVRQLVQGMRTIRPPRKRGAVDPAEPITAEVEKDNELVG